MVLIFSKGLKGEYPQDQGVYQYFYADGYEQIDGEWSQVGRIDTAIAAKSSNDKRQDGCEPVKYVRNKKNIRYHP